MFIDKGFTHGTVYTRNLLKSSAFTVETLRSLVGRQPRRRGRRKASSTKDKDAVAVEVANALDSGGLSAEAVLSAYAKEPRTWLTFCTGTSSRLPRLATAADLLTGPGAGEWHGPIPDHSRRWYFRPFHMDHFDKSEGGVVKIGTARWMVVAEVADHYLAFHWDNFSRYAHESATSKQQFEFWEHVPAAIDELKDKIGGDWKTVPLNRLVLDDLWGRFIDDDEYSWSHLHLRAEANGVALNARSAGVREIEGKGLTTLANALAKAAARAADAKGPAALRKIENALILVLIHKWGTCSYEFRLKKGGEALFRGHCYFGGKPQGQDSLVHVRCFVESGASPKALDFLLRELEGHEEL